MAASVVKYVFSALSTDAQPTTLPSGVALDSTVQATLIEQDTGREWYWSGAAWAPKTTDDDTADDPVVLALGEMLLELRALRSGVELFFAMDRGLQIDLKTEAVTELQLQE